MMGDAVALTAIGPREMSTAGSLQAVRMLEAEVVARQWPHELIHTGRRIRPEIVVAGKTMMPEREVVTDDESLVVHLPATTGTPLDGGLLVLAHYDTVANTPGAVDNAAAVAVGLELLRMLEHAQRPRPVSVAFTAAEELGLAGAEAVAAALQERDALPALAVSLDLIGERGTLTLNGLGPRIGYAWRTRLAAIAGLADVPLSAPLPHQVVSRLLPQLERSDHGVFTRRDVPALHLYHRSARRIYLHYHREGDTPDHLDPASLEGAARFLRELALDAAPYPTSTGGGVWYGGTAALVLPTWLAFAMEALAAGIVLLLVARWRRAPRSPGRRLGRRWACLLWAAALIVAAIVEWQWRLAAEHPAPWVHAPGFAAFALASIAVTVAALLAHRLLGRGRSAPGDGRHASLGALVALIPGLLLLAVGVVELAWLPLAIALALAASLRWRRPWARAAALLVATALCFPLIDPDFLREATYHHFYPAALPLAGWVGIATLAPAIAAFEHIGVLSGRRGRTVVLALAAVTAVTIAFALTRPTCSGEAFAGRGLACETSLR